MTGNRKVLAIASILLVVLFAASVFARNRVNSIRGEQATLEEVLYLPSGKTLKRMSLGYSSLLADIYWTRAVQYFGSRVRRSTHFELLDPLLDITTDLDPNLIVAYEDGAIFLAQQPPMGAGQPDKAVALAEKGIRENPSHWRLYFTLGFIQYLERHDYKAAEEAFRKGSEVPGALPWMKVMAARMAEKGKNIETAVTLWQTIYNSTNDKELKKTAIQHLDSLRADADLDELQHRVQVYRERTGSEPSQWADLIRAGLVPGIPVDPTGMPYKLGSGGRVTVQDPANFKFLGEFRNTN
jgi:tetratricopeptide (TPR) repeat protein